MIYFRDETNATLFGTPSHTDEGFIDAEVPIVEYAQCDGGELELAVMILDRKIPHKARVYTFVGDDARTIAVNWNTFRSTGRAVV